MGLRESLEHRVKRLVSARSYDLALDSLVAFCQLTLHGDWQLSIRRVEAVGLLTTDVTAE